MVYCPLAPVQPGLWGSQDHDVGHENLCLCQLISNWAASRYTEAGRGPLGNKQQCPLPKQLEATHPIKISLLQAQEHVQHLQSSLCLCDPLCSRKFGVFTLQSSPLLNSTGSKDLTSQAAAYPPGSASSLNLFTVFSEEELGGMSRRVFSVLHVPVHIFSGKVIDYAICLQSDPISWL